MYPDYKYTPRKPGQKKKRQSRKAARAAMTATAPADIAMPSEISSASPANASPMSMTYGMDTATASQDIFDNISDGLVGGPVQSIDASDAQSQPGSPHDETTRHDLLDIEFESGFDFDFDQFDLFGDEGYAFRDGADASITLPCFASEMF